MRTVSNYVTITRLWDGSTVSLHPKPAAETATLAIGQVIIGTLWGLADGAIGGAVFAWLYNQFAATRSNLV